MNFHRLFASFLLMILFAGMAWASDANLLCQDLHERCSETNKCCSPFVCEAGWCRFHFNDQQDSADSSLLCKKKGESCQSQDECCVGYYCNINGICIVF